MFAFANGLSPCSIVGDWYGFLISFPYIINDRVFRQFVIMVRRTSTIVSGSMGCLVASLFFMSLMLFKLDSYGLDDSACKLRDSFDKHWYTLIASMSLSKWKSPSKWNLLFPRELRGSTETVFSSLLTMCLSIPFRHVFNIIKVFALESERRCTINCTNVYLFRIFCFTFKERRFFNSSVSCF